MNNKNIESVLKLNNLVFDKINFERHGFKSDNEFRFEISSEIFEKKRALQSNFKIRRRKE